MQPGGQQPWENDEMFKQRMMAQNPAAFGMGQQVAPGLPSKVAPPPAPPGMMGGMGGPPQGPVGPPNPAPMQAALAQGPPSPPQPLPQFGPLAGAYGQATPPPDTSVLDDLASVNMDTQAEKGLMDQLLQARALRDTATPGMRGEGGRVQTAANPLEFLGAGIKQYKGNKAAKEAEGKLEKTRSEIGRKEGGLTKLAVKEKGGIGAFLDRFRKEDDKDKSRS